MNNPNKMMLTALIPALLLQGVPLPAAVQPIVGPAFLCEQALAPIAQSGQHPGWSRGLASSEIIKEIFALAYSPEAAAWSGLEERLQTFSTEEAIERFGKVGVAVILEAIFLVGSYDLFLALRRWSAEVSYPLRRKYATQMAELLRAPLESVPEAVQQSVLFRLYRDMIAMTPAGGSDWWMSETQLERTPFQSSFLPFRKLLSDANWAHRMNEFLSRTKIWPTYSSTHLRAA